jgi:outer membrane protein TolC
VVAELARNYFELRGAQWRLAVAERSLQNQRETLRLTQLRRDAGVGEEQDVASAAARVAAIDATIPQLEFETKRTQYRLAVLTGTRPGQLSADLSPRNYSPIDRALPIGNAADLLRRRPDVRAAERRLSAATERQGVAVAQLFPQVSVSAFVGFLAGRGSLFFTTQSFASTASPSVTWSAFDLGRARARVRGSNAATEEALASYDEAVLRALEETESSLSNYHAQQARLIKQRCNLRASFPPGLGIKLPAEVIRTMLDETLSIYMDARQPSFGQCIRFAAGHSFRSYHFMSPMSPSLRLKRSRNYHKMGMFPHSSTAAYLGVLPKGHGANLLPVIK